MGDQPAVPAWKGWNVNTTPAPTFLEDVMSQELAEKLEKEELEQIYGKAENHEQFGHTSGSVAQQDFDGEIPPELLEGYGEDETSNDLLMAQMLQMEFDKEADKTLKIQQDHYNRNSKIQVSYEKYRNVHPVQQPEVYSDEEEEAHEHRLEAHNMQFNKKRGIRGTGKQIVTKHDLDMAGRRNATNAMEKFSMNMDTGDTDRHMTKLPNKVYNKLRVHAMAESKRAARLHEKKDQSTATQAVDQRTRLLLFKLLNEGILTEVHGVISVGKESAVLHANGGEKEDHKNKHGGEIVQLPDEVALKVFKTTLSEFKNREKYVRGDFRLANEFKKQNPRKIMKMWAEKEMLNLKRMKKFGITCPEVYKLKNNILVMQFIGRDQVAAPKLKDAKLNKEQLCSAYQQVKDGITNLYRKCSLVHADLSEYNLLWYEGHVYFIDVSQGVDLSHPLAHEFLLRDCKNVIHYFTKHDAHGIKLPTEYELFNEITGMDLEQGVTEEEFLQQIQEYEKELAAHELDSQRKDFAFDLMFNKHQEERRAAGIIQSSDEEEDEEEDDEEEGLEGEELAEEITKLEISSKTEDVKEESGTCETSDT